MCLKFGEADMRSILVIVNYMRVNPTIVDDLVIKLHDKFSKIYVINRNTNDSYKNIEKITNTVVIENKKYSRYLLLIKSFFSLFRKESIDDIKIARRLNCLNFNYIIALAKFLHISNLLDSSLKKISEIKYCQDRICFLSIWLTSEAYSLARLKRRYPRIRAISMAHAHEINPDVNEYSFMMKKIIHEYLDEIVFISEAKYAYYYKYINQIALNLDFSKCKVLYWGSEYFSFSNRIHKDDKFVIVSCSTVEKLKRVDLIADAVSIINRDDVMWYHFGDGVEFENLKRKVESFNEIQNKQIKLMGRIDNITVKEFYYSNKPDLFINVSTSEGIPISVMEAQSYGIPTIVTDVGGEREIVVNNVNGFVISKDITAKELAVYIIDYMNMNEIEKKRMSEGCREFWNKRFNLNKNINSYLKELREN